MFDEPGDGDGCEVNSGKNMKRIVAIWFLIILCLSQGKADIVIEDASSRMLIGNHFRKYVGPEVSNPSDVFASDEFVPLTAKVPNLGLHKDEVWLTFTMENRSQQSTWLLEIAYPLLDDVELYTQGADGQYVSQRSSEQLPFSERRYHVPNHVFALDIEPASSQTYYLRIRSTEQIFLPVYVNRSRAFWESTAKDYLVSGIYIGIVGIMVLYNLFLYFSVSEKGYIYYVLYVAFAGLTQMGIKGYGFQYVWPAWPGFAVVAPIIFGSLSGITAVLLARSFLRVKKYAPRFYRLFQGVNLLFIVSLVLVLVGARQVGFMAMQLATTIGSVTVLIVSFRVMMQGYRPAKYFVLGWSVLLVGSIVFLLKDYGILSYNNFTSYAVQGASAIQMALLSFGLAYRINILKQERAASQARVLLTLRENEKLIRDQNVVLEQKVEERTSELQDSNRVLQETLTNLKETQAQLVESEKMASLGQLTAGIAHEINNPINFVTSNVGPLKRDVALLWTAFAEVEKIGLSDTPLEEKKVRLTQYKESIDVDYLRTEIEFLLKGMHEGASRTAEIVKSMRIFSRVDEDVLKYADINEGLESTLVILNSVIKESVDVHTRWGDVPSVECYPGKLNQVFLNLITNAVYAINEKFGKQRGGLLTIVTERHGEDVHIAIADNGVGMPKDVMERIFEPFFTTKDVGEGTGLGMSIVYKTIKKHNGEIKIHSEEGEGTTFTLIIPIKQYKNE